MHTLLEKGVMSVVTAREEFVKQTSRREAAINISFSFKAKKFV